jgi:hypothetical protein
VGPVTARGPQGRTTEMTRRTLDLIFSVGGLLLAVLILILGLVLQNQANFADNYVHDQLAAQQITFTPADKLGESTQAQCLIDNAGQQLVTGKQAECYANEYIAVHLSETNDGKTYSQTSNEARTLQSQLKEDPTNTELQGQVEAVNAKVETLFRGETLRGLLLTSYGFSIFGERAGQAALVSFLVAGVLFLASIAGFIHAFTTPKDKKVLEA